MQIKSEKSSHFPDYLQLKETEREIKRERGRETCSKSIEQYFLRLIFLVLEVFGDPRVEFLLSSFLMKKIRVIHLRKK